MDWIRLIEDLRNQRDIDRAIRACETLSVEADESHIQELYALLLDGSFFVREAAAPPLVRLEGGKALSALLHALTRGKQEGHDNDGLISVIAELLETHESEVAPMLLDLLKDANSETRANAAWALGFITSQITADPLLDILIEDKSSEVRSAAIGALGSFKGILKVVDELIRALQDKDEEVRNSAISSLGYLGDNRAIVPLKLILKDSSGRTRELAEYALSQLKAR